MKQPAFQFYTGDWLKDPALSLCSPAARGVWIDLISAMHESGRSGKISGTPEQLARIARCSVEEFLQNRIELESTKAATVTESNGVVTLINRRMKREDKARKQTAKRVYRHRHRTEAETSNGLGNADETALKQSVSSSSSSSDQDHIQDPPLISPKSRARKTKTLIPGDWTPSQATLDFCIAHRLPEPEYQRLLFITYWQGRGEARPDWDASFRNWMLSPYRKDRNNAQHQGRPGGQPSQAERNARAARQNFGPFLPPRDGEG